MIRDLHRGFDQLDREIELLREIDKTIVEHGRNGGDRTLEALFIESLDEFSKIHHMDAPLLCYVHLGTEYVLLNNASATNYPSRLAADVLAPIFQNARGHSATRTLLGEDPENPVLRQFPHARCMFLQPMLSADGDLLCVFLLPDSYPVEGSHLKDPDFARSASALIRQLSIAYSNYDRAQQHKSIQALWDGFVRHELSPTACFQELAFRIPSFLPSFGPMTFVGKKPEVQVLILDRDAKERPSHLVIRGTTGAEYDGTRISIRESICGYLVEDPALTHFCDDPTKSDYEGRYKSYLGHDIHTELAVPLRINGQLIGVLNLESEIANAFNKHHIAAIRSLSNTVAPIVSVFEKRLGMNTLMQATVTASTARYLKGLAGVFRHASETPLLDLSSNIQLASDLTEKDIKSELSNMTAVANKDVKQVLRAPIKTIEDKLEKTEAALQRLSAILAQISTYTRNFVDDIDSYAQSGPLSLKELVESSIALANAAIIIKSGKDIRIEFERKPDAPAPTVFCSTLLKQHIFSILHNAVLSIQARMENDPSAGLIKIDIFRFSPPASQEVKLNESWAVRLRDNGSGVTKEQLDRLRRFQPGVRFRQSVGHGHGLTAAARYMASLGGRIDLDGAPNEFFEVILHFPVLTDAEIDSQIEAQSRAQAATNS